jgi:hypothetical protein
MDMHLTEDELVLHYYGEMADAEETHATTHLSRCVECHEGYRRLQRVLAAVDDSALAGPELPPHFERTVWARLEPNLPRGHRSWFSWVAVSPGRLAWIATLVVLVGAAFMAGRLAPRQPQTTPNQIAVADDAKVRERILLIDLDDHLEQSQMVLVELVSADDREPVNMGEERNRAEQLVSANRLYRQTAVSNGDSALADLLDELERVLVDVAASPEHVSSQDLGELRRQIESRSLLFKVRVVSSEVRQRQRAIVQERAGQRSSL